MSNEQNPKREYDLEERTFAFAKSERLFAKTLPRTISNIEDVKQLIHETNQLLKNQNDNSKEFGSLHFVACVLFGTCYLEF